MSTLAAPPPATNERYCKKCEPRHKVYMHFMHAKGGWYCQFLLPDLKTPLRRKFTFQTPDKVMELAMRGGADTSLNNRKDIDDAIEQGRGSVWLSLTDEQFKRLQ